jgi:hypothetical protein
MEKLGVDMPDHRIRSTDSIDIPKLEKWNLWMEAQWQDRYDLFDVDVKCFHTLFSGTQAGRVFMMTERGYVGFAPEIVVVGDHVVVGPADFKSRERKHMGYP